jgi:ribosomal protein S18 acetylase RimI-like enzyme
MRNIEELSMNAWPALQTTLYDGWVIRFAEGYTRRANSINPIYYSNEDVQVKIDYCEKIYKEKNLRTIFKITENSFPEDLDRVLEERGYIFEYHTSLQVLDLTNIEIADFNDVRIEESFSGEWLNAYCRLSSVNHRNKETLIKMLKSIVTPHCYVSILHEGCVIACGLGVMERDYIGLFDIVVDEKYRNQGYGEKLIKSIIYTGKNKGVRNAYLQVLLNNTAALKLYSKLGFKEHYSYWYRVK